MAEPTKEEMEKERCPVCGRFYCLHYRLERLEKARKIPAQQVLGAIARLMEAKDG